MQILTKIIKPLIIITVLFLVHMTLCAQNTFTISNRKAISLDMTSVYTAGVPSRIIADDSQWLNYTTLIKNNEPTASIAVEIASGNIPEGVEVFIEASPYKGLSKGKPGNSTGKVSVSHMPRTIIENIGTSYTGSGKNEGHQLTFSFEIKDYALLEPGAYTIYVQYTITQ